MPSTWTERSQRRLEQLPAHGIKDGIDSGANEPGTLRFELIQDESDPNRFYLNEGYESAEAFDVHANGEHIKAFFAEVMPYVQGPTWLIKGNRVRV